MGKGSARGAPGRPMPGAVLTNFSVAERYGCPHGSGIAFLDSGIGGLPYLARARELLPGETFLYLADTEGFPYGGKDDKTIRELVLDRVERLVRLHSPTILVIACNTASQLALNAVRKAFPRLPVIGTVPAVKPAAETSLKRRIGIIATESTVRSPYLDELVRRHAAGCLVLREGAPELVRFVETEFLRSNAAGRRAAVAPHLQSFMESGVDRIVLACTHFLHVSADIQSFARETDPEASVVDSREGVARRLANVLRERRLSGLAETVHAERTTQCDGILFLSGRTGDTEDYDMWARKYGLSGPEMLGT